jgi:hypothetical protein|nr:MAG TPA: MerR HTH family regulatory protein [Herelleviridae sp.]
MTKNKVEVGIRDPQSGKVIPIPKIDLKDTSIIMPVARVEPHPFQFNFAQGNQIIGQLTINLNGHMTFTGKVDQSAQKFFDNIIAKHLPYQKALAVLAAAEKLVACKGRYHSQLNYEALAKLLGVEKPAVSAWHDRNTVKPTLPTPEPEDAAPYREIAVLTRWEGIRGECVGWYREKYGTFQHADGTCEGEVGWGGIVYRCIAWTEIPE